MIISGLIALFLFPPSLDKMESSMYRSALTVLKLTEEDYLEEDETGTPFFRVKILKQNYHISLTTRFCTTHVLLFVKQLLLTW